MTLLSSKRVLVLGNMHELVLEYLQQNTDMVQIKKVDEVSRFLVKEGGSIQAVISSAYLGLKKRVD